MTMLTNETLPDAVGAQVERGVRPCPFCADTDGSDEQGETYRWRLWACACGAKGPDVRCNITGSGQGGVKESRQLALKAWNERPLEAVLRSEREVLARWIAEACGVLFSVEEDAEDGGESLRLLRERGLELVRAVLLPAGPNAADKPGAVAPRP